MTPALNTYMGWTTDGDLEEWQSQHERADGIGFIIGKNAVSVELDRNGTLLDAQTFMITGVASLDSGSVGSDSGNAAREQLMVLCPADADIRRSDRFSYNAYPSGRLNYKIARVEKAFNGMIQAFAEVMQ